MASIVRLLAVLGKINPAIWDAIIPHGPVGPHGAAFRSFSKGAEVALNPQPLPPHELLLASAAVAHDIAFAAVSAEAAGDGASRIVSRAIDDWCGTRPRRIPIPWPGPWPFPWPPEPDPHPEWDIAASRVVGALSLASVASRLEDGDARDALSKGAEQLMEAGLAE